MRALAAVLIALTTACGPSLKQTPVETRRFRATSSSCGQELASTAFRATGARWGESITVSMCYPSDRSVDIRAAVITTNQSTYTSLGDGVDGIQSSRCRLVDAEAAVESSPTPSPRDPGTESGLPASGATAGAARQGPQVLHQEAATGRACPIFDHTRTHINLHVPPVPKGDRIKVILWATKPVDVAGLVIDLTHNIDKPNVSDEEWQAHLDQQRAKAKRRATNRVAYTPSHEPWTPPPPPKAEHQPLPAPSANATWIAGYWHWADGSWHWLSGQWRVPPSDYQNGRTLTARFAPPSLRVETPGPRPFSGTVWIGGYWSWNGTQYVWIQGHWAIPPRSGESWRRHRWQQHDGHYVFVPGGWR